MDLKRKTRPTQADRTVASMAELMRELKEAQEERRPSQEELEKARELQVLTLPGLWETNGTALGSLTEMIRFGLTEDHFDTLVAGAANLPWMTSPG